MVLALVALALSCLALAVALRARHRAAAGRRQAASCGPRRPRVFLDRRALDVLQQLQAEFPGWTVAPKVALPELLHMPRLADLVSVDYVLCDQHGAVRALVLLGAPHRKNEPEAQWLASAGYELLTLDPSGVVDWPTLRTQVLQALPTLTYRGSSVRTP